MSFRKSRKIKANRGRKNGKPHWCCWCGEDINLGAKAVYFANIFEGDFCDGRLHPECYLAFRDENWRTREPVEFFGDQPRGGEPAFPAMFQEDYDEMLKHEEITPYAQ